MEELKTTPSEPTESAPAMAAKALDAELNAQSISVPGQPAVVNDLTSLVVKKKKKAAELDAPAKRRADDGEVMAALLQRRQSWKRMHNHEDLFISTIALVIFVRMVHWLLQSLHA